MASCRMGESVHHSVADQYGSFLHGMPNGFVKGAAFVGSSRAVNPTLTIVALALRAAAFSGEPLG